MHIFDSLCYTFISLQIISLKVVCKGRKMYEKHYETQFIINPLNAELNPICPLISLFGAHRILRVSRQRVDGYTCSYLD